MKVESLREHAKAGDIKAQLQLGIMYHQGWFFNVDFKEASRWILLAASNGNPDAQNKAGYIYWLGQGVEVDHSKAESFWRLAAEKGIIEAARNLEYKQSPDFEPSFGPIPDMLPKEPQSNLRKAANVVGILIVLWLIFTGIQRARSFKQPPVQPQKDEVQE